MKNILIIGCGEIGTRYFNAISNLSFNNKITLCDIKFKKQINLENFIKKNNCKKNYLKL